MVKYPSKTSGMASTPSLLNPRALKFVPGRLAHPVEDYQTARVQNFEQQLVAARNRALANEFSYYFGTSTIILTAWQSICHICGIWPVPPNLADCKKVLRKTHVNLFDLVEARRYGRIVKCWGSRRELARYSRETGRIFPVAEAKEGTLLRRMLKFLH